mgnify:CR=1 FL=1
MAGAGLVDDPNDRGIAQHLHRFKRRRPDKSIEQATAREEVAHLFTSKGSRTVMSTIPACQSSVAFPLGLAFRLVMIQYVIFNSRLRYLETIDAPELIHNLEI